MRSIEDDSCREIASLATEYLEAALDTRDRERFEAHLRECPGCVTYLEQIRTTSSLAREASPPPLDPAERDAFLAALRKWKASRAQAGPEG